MENLNFWIAIIGLAIMLIGQWAKNQFMLWKMWADIKSLKDERCGERLSKMDIAMAELKTEVKHLRDREAA